MKSIFAFAVSVFAAMFLFGTMLSAQRTDTLVVSDLYVSHIIFPSDISYYTWSGDENIKVRLVGENSNIIAMKANTPFDIPCSVSCLESSGTMHTFIIRYTRNPSVLIYDRRSERNTMTAPQQGQSALRGESGPAVSPDSFQGSVPGGSPGVNSSNWKGGMAPPMSFVAEYPRGLFHLGVKNYGIEIHCTNIFVHNDITYLAFSIYNGSGISYVLDNMSFNISEKGGKTKRSRRTVVSTPVFARSRWGANTVAPGSTVNFAFSFDKLTLVRKQVLEVEFFEKGGSRAFNMTIPGRDINGARDEFSSYR